MNEAPLILIRAAAMRDAAGVRLRDAALLVQDGRILAVGGLKAIEQSTEHFGRPDRAIDLPDRLVLPALVNAHAHLDLTDMGPVSYTGRFTDWIAKVMAHRKTQGETGIQSAMLAGLKASYTSGVGWVGDICGTPGTPSSPAAIDARRHAPPPLNLPGVAYLEQFGIGSTEARAIEALHAAAEQWPNTNLDAFAPSIRIGLQPHAPYSAGVALYELAAKLAQLHGLALSTHLAETPEELEFLRSGTGVYADLLKQLGRWDGSIKPSGLHPVDHLAPTLAQARWLVAHCNYVDDTHIQRLAATQTSVAYCPIASEYFGHKNHRYRDMLAAGVNVCLGTDSILCQPSDEPQPLGVLPAIRRLFHRDGTPPETLLRMATINGLTALGISPAMATLAPGAPAKFVTATINTHEATDPLEQLLAGRGTLSPLPLE